MQKYYWVNQGATYADEFQAGCLWAPQVNVNGARLNHWETMDKLNPGDIVFTYANKLLRGYAIVTAKSSPMLKPFASGAAYSPSQGGRIVFCDYVAVNAPVPFNVISATPGLVAALSAGINPVIDAAGKVCVKYLCPVTAGTANQLLALLGVVGIAPAPAAPIGGAIPPTTAKALVDARLGQGQFRTSLLAAFGGACPITGLNVHRLLRASHIKPWAKSSNFERLDPHNGLLLAAGVDAAFDSGYIGFDATNGAMLVQPGFNPLLNTLGIPAGAMLPIPYLTPARAAHLQDHRQRYNL